MLSPDGPPAKGVQLRFTRDGGYLSALCDKTDAEGRTVVTATPGAARPHTRIRSLSGDAAYREWRNANRSDPEAEATITITLPDLTIPGPELEIRLPAAWDR